MPFGDVRRTSSRDVDPIVIPRARDAAQTERMMEALLVLAALVVVWLAGLLTLMWVVPALIVALVANAADEPAVRPARVEVVSRP
jgi:hypothetical protein